MALSEILARRKDLVEESLGIITMWLRDLLVARHAPAHVLNKDRLDTLSKTAQTVTPVQLLAYIDAVDHARESLKSNTNLRLTLDAMVLTMSGVTA